MRPTLRLDRAETRSSAANRRPCRTRAYAAPSTGRVDQGANGLALSETVVGRDRLGRGEDLNSYTLSLQLPQRLRADLEHPQHAGREDDRRRPVRLHRVELELLATQPTGGGEAALDALVQQVAAALASDPSLGGLAENLTIAPPEVGTLAIEGAAPILTARLTLTVEYLVSDPLAVPPTGIPIDEHFFEEHCRPQRRRLPGRCRVERSGLESSGRGRERSSYPTTTRSECIRAAGRGRAGPARPSPRPACRRRSGR